MDNPFRGELSVSAQSMENVYEYVMDGSVDRLIVKVPHHNRQSEARPIASMQIAAHWVEKLVQGR
jgi:hypothetical protein